MVNKSPQLQPIQLNNNDAPLKGPRYVIHREQEGYPPAFMELPDAPQTLYLIGNPEVLQPGLAIIGARKATPYGLSCAKKFASLAASQGIPIISGGAVGCDSAAHRAALEAGGKTLAVLGGGCDKLYPEKNTQLFQNIIEAGGAVMAEQAWSFPPMPHTFRLRNRLIAGLAQATLIVEAGIPSGTFSTADEALAANREVLVVPGAITSPNSQGTNRLLHQGATPIIDVDTFQDVLFDLFGYLKYPATEEAKETIEDPVLRALYAKPMRIDEMICLVKDEESPSKKIKTLMTHLSELQRKGYITSYPDGTYGPAEKAFKNLP